jgi:MFS family permease
VFAEYLQQEQKHELTIWGCKARAKLPPLASNLQQTGTGSTNRQEESSKGCLVAVRSFPIAFWLENFVIISCVSILYVSANFFPELLVNEYHMTKQEAGVCSSLIYGMTLFAPVFGAVVDVYGRRLLIQTLSIVFAIIGFLLFYLTAISPWILVPFCGFCFAWMEQNCYSLLGRSFQMMDFDASGVGYGIMGTFLNAGLMVIPPLLGILMAESGPKTQSLLYVGSLSLGLVISLAMFVADKNHVLNGVGETLATQQPTTPLRRRSNSFSLQTGVLA